MAASGGYSLEPTTFGKVLLETNAGKIQIDLFSRETPLACRRFTQLCADNAFEKVPFNRVIANTLVQVGNVKNWKQYEGFKDEIHSRLQFRRRGLVAMSHDDENINRCQFFITLEATPWLNKKFTIFGTVVAEHIFNCLKIGECLLKEGSETPVEPYFIKSCKILEQPFSGEVISPSSFLKDYQDDLKAAAAANNKQVSNKKQKVALSFGNEDEDDEIVIVAKKNLVKTIGVNHDSSSDTEETNNNNTAKEIINTTIHHAKEEEATPAASAPEKTNAPPTENNTTDKMLERLMKFKSKHAIA